MRKKQLVSLSFTTSMCHFFNVLLFFHVIDNFHLCSHVFGTVSDPDGSQIATAEDDAEDEYEIVRRQRSAKRARNATQRAASLEV